MKSKTPTAQIISSNSDHPDALVIAGEMINMTFRKGNALSLPAGKLLFMLIKEAGVNVTEDVQHRVSLHKLNFLHRSKADLIDIIEELQSTLVSVELVSQNLRYTQSGALLADVEREHADGGELRFNFSKTIRHLISNSTHWATLSKRIMMAFDSRYAFKLYTYLSLRVGLKYKHKEDLSLEAFREMMGVPAGKMNRWADIRRYVLKPAIDEINQLCGFTVSYTTPPNKRRVTSLTLHWTIKSEAEGIEAAKELDRHRTGRKARREGTVEAVIPVEEMAAVQHQNRERVAQDLASAAVPDQS